MRIRSVHLPSRDPIAALKFYRDILGLPASESSVPPQVMVGTTVINLVSRQFIEGAMHLAFTIPQNQVYAAHQWLSERLQPLKKSGADTYRKPVPWQSESIYFKGPDGVILELIARKALANATDGPFSSSDLLCVSEVGLSVADVVETSEQACEAFGLEPLGPTSEHFAAVGDQEGLLIFVRRGRPWIPTLNAVAVGGPSAVVITDVPRSSTLELDFGRITSVRGSGVSVDDRRASVVRDQTMLPDATDRITAEPPSLGARSPIRSAPEETGGPWHGERVVVCAHFRRKLAQRFDPSAAVLSADPQRDLDQALALSMSPLGWWRLVGPGIGGVSVASYGQLQSAESHIGHVRLRDELVEQFGGGAAFEGGELDVC